MANENKKDFNAMMKNNKDMPKIQILLDAQQEDYKTTLNEFDDRYNLILEQMEKRKAPKDQYFQIEKIRNQYIIGKM